MAKHEQWILHIFLVVSSVTAALRCAGEAAKSNIAMGPFRKSFTYHLKSKCKAVFSLEDKTRKT